ncbi:glycoside hydrolase superfamily [Chytriomyces sp. MP71]|nr:glycoside hydrolase superfamily [Chytriomyces sp. MP71]
MERKVWPEVPFLRGSAKHSVQRHIRRRDSLRPGSVYDRHVPFQCANLERWDECERVLEGFDLVTDVAITHLATRLNQIIDQTGREVYMRWLPEMNGSWMKYGLQPARYVEVWIRMFGIFRQIAPRVKLVWSPNYDLRDPSYWPGPQYVDWIGSSCYWKGWGVNALIDQSYPMETVSYVYNTYAVPYNFPFMITEASAAWESGPGVSPITGESFAHVTNQVTQAVLQQSFWSGILAHEVLLQYPLLRAAYIFEVAKQEEFFTDFRVSNDSVTLTTFELLISAADAMGDLEWANVTVRSTSTTRTTTSTTTRLTTSSEILPTVVTVYSKAIPTLVSPTTNVATRFSDSSLVFMLCTVLAQLSFV